MIKFVNDLRQVSGFLCTPVSSTNKTDNHDIAEILLKVALKTITITPNTFIYMYIIYIQMYIINILCIVVIISIIITQC